MEKVTLKRRRNEDGDRIYQISPDDLPLNAPPPPWLPREDFDPFVKKAITITEEIANDWKPLPEGGDGEVTEIDKRTWDGYFAPKPIGDALSDINDLLP